MIVKVTKRAQRGYYRMSGPRHTLPSRIETLQQIIPAGSKVVDIGCNNGAIGLALLNSGAASTVIGMDLENILKPKCQDRIEFRPINVNICDLEEDIPASDVILLLNVLHHTVGHSPQRARDVVNCLLGKCVTLIIDMGSPKERGRRGWKRAINAEWSGQCAMWADLFRNAKFRQRVLAYPQNGSKRIMWHLSACDKPLSGDFHVLQRYRRPAAIRPSSKGLVAVDDWNHAPRPIGKKLNQLVPYARFRKIVDRQTGVLVFSKRYRHETATDVIREWSIYDRLTAEFGDHIVSPIGYTDPYGFLYLFDHELLTGAPIHFRYGGWRHYVKDSENRQLIRKIANTEIDGPLVSARVKNATDFQIVQTTTGLRFIDFNVLKRHRKNWVLKNGRKPLLQIPNGCAVLPTT